MANHTIYPYGQPGEAASTLEIVDDLETGGRNKVLSAEQGKVLKLSLPTGVEEEGIFFVDSEYNIGYSPIQPVVEQGLYFVDENFNIGFFVNTTGLHAANLVEYEKY